MPLTGEEYGVGRELFSQPNITSYRDQGFRELEMRHPHDEEGVIRIIENLGVDEYLIVPEANLPSSFSRKDVIKNCEYLNPQSDDMNDFQRKGDKIKLNLSDYTQKDDIYYTRTPDNQIAEGLNRLDPDKNPTGFMFYDNSGDVKMVPLFSLADGALIYSASEKGGMERIDIVSTCKGSEADVKVPSISNPPEYKTTSFKDPLKSKDLMKIIGSDDYYTEFLGDFTRIYDDTRRRFTLVNLPTFDPDFKHLTRWRDLERADSASKPGYRYFSSGNQVINGKNRRGNPEQYCKHDVAGLFKLDRDFPDLNPQNRLIMTSPFSVFTPEMMGFRYKMGRKVFYERSDGKKEHPGKAEQELVGCKKLSMDGPERCIENSYKMVHKNIDEYLRRFEEEYLLQ